jgi:hypothetical protein
MTTVNPLQNIYVDRSANITPRPHSRNRQSSYQQQQQQYQTQQPSSQSLSHTTPLRNTVKTSSAAQPGSSTPLQSYTNSPLLDGSFIAPSITPARPTLDPTSPFVVPSTVKNAAFFMQEPASVQKGMRAKLFGQGVEGGYLVSPQGATPWKTSGAKSGMGGGMSMDVHGGINFTPMSGSDLHHHLAGGTDPFLVGPEDTATIANWDGSLSGDGSYAGVSGMDLNTDLDVSMGLHQMGDGARFGLGFDYLDHHPTSGSSGGSSVSNAFVSTPSGKYPSTLGLGSGYAPSSRKPINRLVSGSSMRPNGPVLSIQPASSPLPSFAPGSSTPSSSLGSNGAVGLPGPASRRMMQQMNQTGSAADNVNNNQNMSARSVSSTYEGMAPRPGLTMNRSASTSALTMGGQASAFTSRPLARMGGFRPVSSSGVADEGEMPISPHLFPASSMTPTLSEGTSPAFTYQFQPYIGTHHRHISALSGTTIDTPALESSIPSPDFSTHHHSPLVTPLVGPSSAGLLPNNAQYFPAPNPAEYQFQQKLNGLAIQVEGTERMWDSGPMSSVTTISMADTIQSAQGLSQDQTGVPNGFVELTNDMRSPNTPIDGQMGQLQAAQAAAFQVYQTTGDFNSMPLQSYEMSSNASLEVPSTAHSTMSDQQQWATGEQISYQMPLQLSAPPTTSRSIAQSQMRHVSSPYDIYPTGAQLQLQPPLPMPRSVSAGYVPVMNTGLGQDAYASSSQGQTREEVSFPVNASLEATIKGGAFGAAAAYQSTPGSSMGLMAAVLEGGDDRAAKRQRVKYPPVGKRLRPGPKPKPKTPKSKRREGSSARTVSNPESLPYDPFVQIARTGTIEMTSQLPNQQFSVHVELQEPTFLPEASQQDRRSETPADMTAAVKSTAKAEDSQADSHAPDSQSNVTRSYLESCYIMFMQADKESGGAPVKRYRCNIDDCERVFPRKSAIHSHIQTHLEDKPFVCTAPDWLVVVWRVDLQVVALV